MRALLIILVSAFAASYLVGSVAIATVHDYTHPPGPCSVLDYRRCGR